MARFSRRYRLDKIKRMLRQPTPIFVIENADLMALDRGRL